MIFIDYESQKDKNLDQIQVQEEVKMPALSPKKISINSEQKQFLENYSQWGFADQSSMVREALNRLISDLKKNKQKSQMAQKARELVSEYNTDNELTAFTNLDSEDFL